MKGVLPLSPSLFLERGNGPLSLGLICVHCHDDLIAWIYRFRGGLSYQCRLVMLCLVQPNFGAPTRISTLRFGYI